MIIKSYKAEEDIKILNNGLSLFYGENIGQIDDFKKKILSTNNESEINRISQNEIIADKEKFHSNLFNISLFKDQKIFLIDQCNDKILEIILEIEKKITNQRIYLFANILDKKSKLRNFFEKSKKNSVIACYEDNEITLRNIISKKMKNCKGVTPQIINLLISYCNFDRSKLDNEINKILVFFHNKNLNLDDLTNILNLKENDKFNDLKDTAINGDRTKTNNLLNNSYLNEDKNTMYIYMINQRLNIIKEIIDLSNKKNFIETINLIKPPIFWKDKPIITSQLKKWNINKINKALKKTYECEEIIKSKAFINKNIITKKMIIDICNLANAA